MKRIYLVWFACLYGFASNLCAQPAVTLDQCQAWARANYPEIRRYGLIAQTEQYTLSNAAKSWFPQLAVSAKASYQSDVTRLPFDGEKIAALIPGFSVPTLSKDQYQVVAEVNQTLWDGGLIHASRQRSRAEAEADRRQLESDLYTLNDRVNQLYFGCLLQDALLSQNALLQEDWQVNLDRIDAMITNGVANQSDRESMEVELLNTRQKEIELRACRAAYFRMLETLTGKSLAQSRLETPAWAGEPLPDTIDRPQLRVFDARNTLLDVQNKQLTAGIRPLLSAFVQGGYGRPGLDMLDDSFQPFYVAGLRLTWNLGKLYTLKNDRKKIGVQNRAVEVGRETFLFNTRLEMLREQMEIRKYTDLIQGDEAIVSLRVSIRKAAEVKLENGTISVTDLIREIHAEDLAREAASTRRIQQLQAIYNYRYTTNQPASSQIRQPGSSPAQEPGAAVTSLHGGLQF